MLTKILYVYRVLNLIILPSNIAIPTSLTIDNEESQLQFVFFVQLEDGFLSKNNLEVAVQVYTNQ